jgi:hypothetical protein
MRPLAIFSINCTIFHNKVHKLKKVLDLNENHINKFDNKLSIIDWQSIAHNKTNVDSIYSNNMYEIYSS